MEQQYISLVNRILNCKERQTRNSITKSCFGESITLKPLDCGFPLLMGRRLFWKSVVGELATFLKGNITNVADFEANNCNYWNLWKHNPQGDINVDYGNSWRDFNGEDQLANVVKSLQEDPNSRRHLISGWRPDHLTNLDLPCCHYAYQWYVNGGELEMMWHQRSTDVMIGLPSDIILASLWNALMANTIGLRPGKITMSLGDTHIYKAHYIGANTYLQQAKQHSLFAVLWLLDPKADVFNFTPDMFEIRCYEPQPVIKFKLEV